MMTYVFLCQDAPGFHVRIYLSPDEPYSMDC